MADLKIKPDEITSILKERIEGIEDGGSDLSEVGTVLSIADGIARVHGLDNAMSLEMLELPHDGKGEIQTDETRPAEFKAPGVVQRKSVHEPLQTGIKAIDAMIPIG